MKTITTTGNTVAPSLLALEALGFTVHVAQSSAGDRCRATRHRETYEAADPVEVLGLVRLVELRGWDWQTTDDELEEVGRRHALSEDFDPAQCDVPDAARVERIQIALGAPRHGIDVSIRLGDFELSCAASMC
jgi:hypothetical protein